MRFRATLTVLAGLGLAGSGLAVPTAAEAVSASADSDFDGDGYLDAVIGSWGATVNKRSWAGHVTVLYGSAAGLSTTKRQNLNQDSPGVPGAAEVSDMFGKTTTAADFNADGYADLAVGAPNEATTAGRNAGAVNVFFGSASGLGRPIIITEPGGGDQDNYFGQTVDASDINGDGRPEILITTGFDPTWIGTFGAGAAQPSFTTFPALWEPGYVPYNAVGGDVTGDGYGDVVTLTAGGSISLRRGGPSGLGERGPELPAGDGSIVDVVIDDINRDGRDDVVAGRPKAAKGGAFSVYYGTASGLKTGPTAGQDSAGVPGAGEAYDGFGDSLAVGDANGDGYADVAVGAAFEDIGSSVDTGMVVLFKGGPQGLTSAGVTAWNQNTAGVPGGNETYDEFGDDLSLIDHNRDGKADLTIGASGENATGAVTVMRGTAGGITTTGARWIDPAAVAAPSGNGYFGQTLLK